MEYYRRILIAYEQEVLKSIPNPFGSFEKAKYELCCYKNSIPLYSFVTTTRNTEECVVIMKNVWKKYRTEAKTYAIFKIQGGERKIIYTDKSWEL